MLHVATVSIELIHLLRPLAGRIRWRDRSLADQLVRAANSIALNVAEAERSEGGTVRSRFHSAAGSANETRMALRVAVAWGYVTAAAAQAAEKHLDRVNAMLWKLTRGRPIGGCPRARLEAMRLWVLLGVVIVVAAACSAEPSEDGAAGEAGTAGEGGGAAMCEEAIGGAPTLGPDGCPLVFAGIEGRHCDVEGQRCGTADDKLASFCDTATPDDDDYESRTYQCGSCGWRLVDYGDCFDCCFGELDADGCPTSHDDAEGVRCVEEGKFCTTEDPNEPCYGHETIRCTDGKWGHRLFEDPSSDCGGGGGGAGASGAAGSGGQP